MKQLWTLRRARRLARQQRALDQAFLADIQARAAEHDVEGGSSDRLAARAGGRE